MSDEWKALLSAYEAGTLSDSEKKLLFEKAAADQALFDELMEAETMRAAMEGPLAKRALLHALEEEMAEEVAPALLAAAAPARAAKVAPIAVKRQSRRGMWFALAACLVAGTFGAYVYFQRPPSVQVAQAPPPQPIAQPVESVAPNAAPAEKAKRNEISKVEVKRQESPGPASPAPAADARQVNEEVAAAAPSASVAPGAPPPPQADAVLALRDAESEAKKESRTKSVMGAARAVGSNLVPVARVVGRRLEIRADVVGQLYVFLSEGARFRKIPGLAPIPLLSNGARSFALPDGVAGTLFVLISPQRDAELDQLTDPHEGVLPVRNWTRINFQ